PAGMTTPFDPVTASSSVAVMRSPTVLVLVHTRCPARSDNPVPAATTPTFPSVLPVVVLDPLTTVLPDGVMTAAGCSRTGVGGGGGAGGVRFTGASATCLAAGFGVGATRAGATCFGSVFVTAGGGVVGT